MKATKVTMVIVGVLLVMGAPGTSDFEIAQTAAGQVVENARSLWLLALQAVVGFALIALATRKSATVARRG